jgi:hypothetical protein
MTAIVLNTYSYFKSGFIAVIASWIIGHLNSMNRAVMLARQTNANQQLARLMLHEYPEHTYSSLLAELNSKTLQDIYRD